MTDGIRPVLSDLINLPVQPDSTRETSVFVPQSRELAASFRQVDSAMDIMGSIVPEDS